MPTLEWIGKDKVVNHHQNVPFRVLEHRYTYNQNGYTETEKRALRLYPLYLGFLPVIF